jgi:hypothetical protein
MIQRTPETVYVNPQQLQRQREHRDEARKSIVPNADPARVLAKAWRPPIPKADRSALQFQIVGNRCCGTGYGHPSSLIGPS